MKNPPFEITNTIIDLVVEIAELVGKLTSIHQLSTNPTLRRTNRIRTICKFRSLSHTCTDI